MYYPAGVSGREIDGKEMTLDEVIENSSRKELVEMIFAKMPTDEEVKLCYRIIKDMSPKEIESFIEDSLYNSSSLKITKEFIKESCPEIAE